ncbi:MAG: metallophosphoesterase [Paludibacteraceae bacterium]|nr:metallophosphoesterase [Paludibacteraceae bacterium]
MSRFFILLVIILFALTAALIFGLYMALRPIVRRRGHKLSYKPFGLATLLLIAVGTAMIIYGNRVGQWQLQTKRYTLIFNNLPEGFEDYRIVHISDLHVGSFADCPERLQTIVNRINRLQPDLICFTGDLINLSPDEIIPALPVLKGLHAHDGIVSILGNHDFTPYNSTPEQQETNLKRIVTIQRDSLHWHLLNNQNFKIRRCKDSIFVIGVMNQSYDKLLVRRAFPIQKADLKKAMRQTDGFRILLTHDPTHWRREVADTLPIPLTLSGHTHGAQLRLFGWTPAAWFFDDVSGLVKNRNRCLYINTGLGGTAPCRIGVPQEITLIKLKKVQ